MRLLRRGRFFRHGFRELLSRESHNLPCPIGEPLVKRQYSSNYKGENIIDIKEIQDEVVKKR
jgi:hypothetical protein